MPPDDKVNERSGPNVVYPVQGGEAQEHMPRSVSTGESFYEAADRVRDLLQTYDPEASFQYNIGVYAANTLVRLCPGLGVDDHIAALYHVTGLRPDEPDPDDVGGALIHPPGAYQTILRRARRIAKGKPDETSISAAFPHNDPQENSARAVVLASGIANFDYILSSLSQYEFVRDSQPMMKVLNGRYVPTTMKGIKIEQLRDVLAHHQCGASLIGKTPFPALEATYQGRLGAVSQQGLVLSLKPVRSTKFIKN